MPEPAVLGGAWWPYILVIVGGLATYFWRALGVALSGRIDADSRLFEWVACVAYAMLRSAEHTSELQSLMRISYAVFCLITKKLNQILQSKNITDSHSTIL